MLYGFGSEVFKKSKSHTSQPVVAGKEPLIFRNWNKCMEKKPYWM